MAESVTLEGRCSRFCCESHENQVDARGVKDKHVRLEPRAELAVFSFRDRGILVALQTGVLFAVLTGSPENVEKVIEWLQGQGIAERDLIKH